MRGSRVGGGNPRGNIHPMMQGTGRTPQMPGRGGQGRGSPWQQSRGGPGMGRIGRGPLLATPSLMPNQQNLGADFGFTQQGVIQEDQMTGQANFIAPRQESFTSSHIYQQKPDLKFYDQALAGDGREQYSRSLDPMGPEGFDLYDPSEPTNEAWVDQGTNDEIMEKKIKLASELLTRGPWSSNMNSNRNTAGPGFQDRSPVWAGNGPHRPAVPIYDGPTPPKQRNLGMGTNQMGSPTGVGRIDNLASAGQMNSSSGMGSQLTVAQRNNQVVPGQMSSQTGIGQMDGQGWTQTPFVAKEEPQFGYRNSRDTFQPKQDLYQQEWARTPQRSDQTPDGARYGKHSDRSPDGAGYGRERQRRKTESQSSARGAPGIKLESQPDSALQEAIQRERQAIMTGTQILSKRQGAPMDVRKLTQGQQMSEEEASRQSKSLGIQAQIDALDRRKAELMKEQQLMNTPGRERSCPQPLLLVNTHLDQSIGQSSTRPSEESLSSASSGPDEQPRLDTSLLGPHPMQVAQQAMAQKGMGSTQQQQGDKAALSNFCKTCQVPFQDFASHVQSEDHKMHSTRSLNRAKAEQYLRRLEKEDQTRGMMCYICDHHYLCEFNQHINSIEHKRKKQLVAGGCSRCQISEFKNYPDYQQHLSSEEHQAKAERTPSKPQKRRSPRPEGQGRRQKGQNKEEEHVQDSQGSRPSSPGQPASSQGSELDLPGPPLSDSQGSQSRSPGQQAKSEQGHPGQQASSQESQPRDPGQEAKPDPGHPAQQTNQPGQQVESQGTAQGSSGLQVNRPSDGEKVVPVPGQQVQPASQGLQQGDGEAEQQQSSQQPGQELEEQETIGNQQPLIIQASNQLAPIIIQPEGAAGSINQDPVGVHFIVPFKGFECKLCKKFFRRESIAKIAHCSNRQHIHEWLKWQKFAEDEGLVPKQEPPDPSRVKTERISPPSQDPAV